MDRAQVKSNDGIGRMLLLAFGITHVALALIFVRVFLSSMALIGIGVMFILLRRILNIERG